MNISNRQQLLGIAAIAAVALFAGDKLVFSPLVKSWKARAAQIAELKKSVGQGTMLRDREKSIRFAMNCPDLDAIVIGFKSQAEIDEAIERMDRALAGA